MRKCNVVFFGTTTRDGVSHFKFRRILALGAVYNLMVVTSSTVNTVASIIFVAKPN